MSPMFPKGYFKQELPLMFAQLEKHPQNTFSLSIVVHICVSVYAYLLVSAE